MMDIQKTAHAFRMDGRPVSWALFGSGHINQTYMITTDTGHSYVLQHINQNVFKDPVGLMENAYGVTTYIRQHGGRAICFLKTVDGKLCYQDETGEYWRAYEFLRGICMDLPETENDFYQSALAFGEFQHQLAGYPAQTLHETIPNFHNTPDRFRQLRQAVEENRSGRLDSAAAEVEFYLSHEALGGRLYGMLQQGILPLRVTHNDTKLNNVLLDPETRAPLCVLDLDTVMPGLSAYDFGDSIRFGAATAAEDEQDLSKMKLDLRLFEVFVRGYLEAAPSLTEEEVKVLPLGAFTMTLECGSRFLKDYLDGDLYFRTAYPEHNLVRCRTQMALCADMLAHWTEMEEIVARIAAQVR
jgi:Ser/Thr protein kinase RdoA (MazF antagonist)